MIFLRIFMGIYFHSANLTISDQINLFAKRTNITRWGAISTHLSIILKLNLQLLWWFGCNSKRPTIGFLNSSTSNYKSPSCSDLFLEVSCQQETTIVDNYTNSNLVFLRPLKQRRIAAIWSHRSVWGGPKMK